MNWLVTAALNAFISVAAGAFGAHALKVRLDEKLLVTFETAARYQMYHALGLGLVGLLALVKPGAQHLDAAGWSMLVGILLFSGSLYALALTGIRGLGAITPLGGVAFLAGWVLLAMAARR